MEDERTKDRGKNKKPGDKERTAKRSLRKTKTDRKDARTIAKFLMENREEISQLSVSQDLQDLRDLARERESLSHLMISATKVEIKRVLRTISPELESIADIYTRVMLHFLQAYPSARLVKAAKLKVLAQALRQPYVGHKLTLVNGFKAALTFKPQFFRINPLRRWIQRMESKFLVIHTIKLLKRNHVLSRRAGRRSGI